MATNGHTVGVEQTAERGDGLTATLRREGRLRHFRRGQTLFTEGDRAERVFLIDRGWVMISCMSPEGREIVLGLRGSGDIIGELSTLDGEARSATALAVAVAERASPSSVDSSPMMSPLPRSPRTISRPSDDMQLIITHPRSMRYTRSARSPSVNSVCPRRKRRTCPSRRSVALRPCPCSAVCFTPTV